VVAFGVQPRRRRGGEKRDVLAAVAVTADLDCPDGAALRRALASLAALPPYTTLVHSGHGLHAYWALRSPRTVAGPDSAAAAERFEKLGQAVADRLGADHTWDLARVLRVPGTLNVKPGRPLAWCWVLELAPAVRYELAELEAAVPPRPRPVAAPPQGPRPMPRRLSPRMRRLIQTGNDGSYPSRSEADFAVACALVRAGYSDEEIVAVFAGHPQGIGQKYAERGDRYLRCVIRGAQAKIGLAS
jgi:hypothetical protein